MQNATDTLVVISQAPAAARDLLPLWTGLLGGLMGIVATYIAARFSRSATQAQLVAQKELASQDLAHRAESHRRELQANFVSAHRVRWIETLRTEIAALCAICVTILTDLPSSVPVETILPMMDKANHHAAVISLLLNHDESTTHELLLPLGKLVTLVETRARTPDSSVDHAEVANLIHAISASARRITKAEWVRVKNFT